MLEVEELDAMAAEVDEILNYLSALGRKVHRLRSAIEEKRRRQAYLAIVETAISNGDEELPYEEANLHELCLPDRVKHLLWFAEIWTIGQLCDWSVESLAHIKNLGQDVIETICRHLDAQDIYLRPEPLIELLEGAVTGPV